MKTDTDAAARWSAEGRNVAIFRVAKYLTELSNKPTIQTEEVEKLLTLRQV